MSDKKEIATLSIKISVDSIDLDKLEAQLKRIEGLMVSVGLKEPTSVGFSADKFFITNGQVFIDSSYITPAPIPSLKIKGTAIDDAMRQAAKEGVRKGAEQARFEITTGINDNSEQVSAEIALKASAEISRASKVISREQSEFEKFKQLIEDKFNHLQSSITAIQHAQANSEIASAGAIEQVRAEIQRKEPLDL
ncbi:hypothetical protein M0J40_RS00295 [Providencia rettgeri]|nr:hypothetical protein [Providencia rettgeri]ELR5127579.1 hypothetical protein [Providencia rettgeri]ELR5243743.1 hypothetical protein [Providencia rettgeri]ELS4585770.1 hypothetical protein [Providencia rettgeri]